MNRPSQLVRGLLAALLIALSAGCSAASPVPMAEGAPSVAGVPAEPAPSAATAIEPKFQLSPPSAADRSWSVDVAQEMLPPAERIVIRTADMTIVVRDVEDSIAHLSRMAAEMDGFVVSSEITRLERGLQGRITLRVDAKRLDEALNRVRGLAIEVRSESVSGQDVTAEYVDLEARLRNLEVAETQLQRLMERSGSIDEVLNVYRELVSVRGQIEQLRGRMQYLKEAAALSSISVFVLQDVLAVPIEVGGWQLGREVRNAVEALISALQWLATAFIWSVIVIAPVLAIVALPFVALVLLLRRRQKSQRAAPIQPPTSST